MIRLAGLATVLLERKFTGIDFDMFKKSVDISVSKSKGSSFSEVGGDDIDIDLKSKPDAPFKYKFKKNGVPIESYSGSKNINIDEILKTIYKKDFSKK